MQPNMLTLPTPAAILAVETDNYRTKTFTLDLRLPANPGQFVMAWLPRFDEKPFSLVEADPVTLMITAVGPFTTLVHDLGVGDRLWLRGPLGQGFALNPTGSLEEPAHRRPVLVGGGYGVAPLLWLARRSVATAEALHVVVGARTHADLLYVERFRALAANHPNLALHVTTEDGSAGVTGRVTPVVEQLLATGAADSIFACGPHGMLAALETLGARFAVPAQLSWEAYMRCGIGICGACEHAGRVLCLDGPVLCTPAPAIPAAATTPTVAAAGNLT